MAFFCGSKIIRNIFQSKKKSSKKAKKDLEIFKKIHQCGDEAIFKDLAILFQRISLSIQTKEDLPTFFEYELSAFPPTLFDANGMRKTINIEFYLNFNFIYDISPHINDYFVIDGCFLLQHIVWPAKTPVKHIINFFINYIVEHYSRKGCVVFDGYPESVDGRWYIKTAERQRKNIGREIEIYEDGIIDVASDKFFNVTTNEVRLIHILCKKLNEAGFSTKIAEEDADALIVEMAMRYANENYRTWIVGTDVELLTILTARTQHLDNIFFLHQEKDFTFHVCSNQSFKYPQLQCIVLFLHAFSGCNTTSSFLNKGKRALIKLFLKRKDLILEAKKFYHTNTPMYEIAFSGIKIAQEFYGGKNRDITLNELRFRRFVKLSRKGLVKFESLPPTEGSVIQHAYRTYLQVQSWLGNKKRATDWGWYMRNGNLIPLHSDMPPFPQELEDY
ncbi:hypothetical protein TKK_0008923 [Trichogramma kaykai]|uniref:Uncharacterized protein n=1 Tax=Trichogramma kaykai TaxID=54128 RepID=A0ABD2X3T7_9HYME